MDSLLLSRAQFGDTAAFHIIWPVMSIGFSFYMLLMEIMWRYTGEERYYRQLRFWANVFILTFGIGVASGIPLQFQFGTNWSSFSLAAGDFFGNILGFESTVAFALEAAFLGIFVFGWKRVGSKMHLFSNAMVFVGATLSAFWIMAANSWMQIPRGVIYQDGKFVVTDYWQAIFNPGTIVSFGHMWLACIVTTLFLMMGLCALALLRNDATHAYKEFFLLAFRYSLVLALIVTPLQLVMGHVSGLVVADYQPQKLAAIELHWDTNKPGTGAAESLIAFPDANSDKNAFAISVPYGLSLLITGSPTGQVKGLNDFAPDTRPNKIEATLAFYSFRVMVGIGLLLTVLLVLGVWYWKKGRLVLEKIAEHKYFWRLWIVAMPLGFVATIAGWMTREIGRQPWVVYNVLRTTDAVTPNLSAPAVATTLIIFNVLYAVCGICFIYFTYRIIVAGPNLSGNVPYKP